MRLRKYLTAAMCIGLLCSFLAVDTLAANEKNPYDDSGCIRRPGPRGDGRPMVGGEETGLPGWPPRTRPHGCRGGGGLSTTACG